MIPETLTSIKGQAGGLALVQKYGQEHLEEIGRMGGRPRALTVDDINRNIASVAQIKERGHHGKGLKELLGLWRQKQACSAIITQEQACFQSGAVGRETRTGLSGPAFSPSRVGLAVIAVPAAPPPIKELASELAEPATGRQKCILTRLCMARGITEPLEEQPMSIGEAGILIRELSKRGSRRSK